MESKYPVSSPPPCRGPHPRLGQGRVCCRPGWKVSTLSPHPLHPESHTRDSDGRICCRPGWKVSTLSPHLPLLQRATPMTQTGEGLPQTWMESKYPVSSPFPSSREPHPRLRQGRVCCRPGWKVSTLSPHPPSSREPHPRLGQGRFCRRPGWKVSTLSPHPPPPPEIHTCNSDREGSAADLDGK